MSIGFLPRSSRIISWAPLTRNIFSVLSGTDRSRKRFRNNRLILGLGFGTSLCHGLLPFPSLIKCTSRTCLEEHPKKTGEGALSLFSRFFRDNSFGYLQLVKCIQRRRLSETHRGRKRFMGNPCFILGSGGISFAKSTSRMLRAASEKRGGNGSRKIDSRPLSESRHVATIGSLSRDEDYPIKDTDRVPARDSPLSRQTSPMTPFNVNVEA